MPTLPAKNAVASKSGTSAQTVPWLWIGIISAATFLRFFQLSRKSIYLDEALSVRYAHFRWRDFVHIISTFEANMTLYYLLLRGMVLLGDSEFWVRLISVIAGVAAVPLMYVLGKRMFDHRTGVLAAWLLAINACHVVYSQEARGYALAVLLTIVSCWLFVTAVQAPSWKRCVAYAVVSALAVYSHFYAVLVLGAQWASLVALPRRLVPVKQVVVTVVVTGVLITPAAVFVMTQNIGQIDWLSRITWLEVYHTVVFLAAEGGKVAGNILLMFCLVGLTVAGRQTWRDAKNEARTTRPREHWKDWFAWLWLLLPMVVTGVGSLWRPMFFHRFLIVCLPAFVLLVARGLMMLRARTAAIIVFSAVGIVTVFLSYSRTREDWRDTVQYVLSHAQPGDAIYFSRGYAAVPYDYYDARMHGVTHPERVADLAALGGRSRLWVVLYPLNAPESTQVESEVEAKYQVVTNAKARGVRVLLCDLQHSPSALGRR